MNVHMRPSVLVIEDSASVRRLIDVCLRPTGAEIRSAEDGLVGLQAAWAAVPDVIVLDIGLPGLDGWGVLSRLRADDRTAEVRVLVLTAQRFTLTETTLQGGRYCSIQGVTAAQLRYSLGEDEVSTLYEVGYDPGTFGPIPDLDQGQRPEQLLVRGLKA